MSSPERQQDPVTLTDRERTILELIADGFSNEEIAAGLALSRNTVKWYIQLIYQKLGVNRRTQAVLQARALGLLGGPGVSDHSLRSHLPTPAAPLIGRETDLATLSGLLNRAEVRLLSIIGLSGMGKTRLALAVAAEWQRQSGRVHFVSLEEISTEEQLIATVAEALGVHLQGQMDLRRSLLMSLRSLSLLLVLDNFDDTLDAAPLVAQWLSASPHLKLLITSCEPLDLSGEHIYAVHGLSYATLPDDQRPSSAVELFLQCACQMQHDYTPDPSEMAAISQICHLVEGMPLAIEIAAAWVCTISLEQIYSAIKHDLESLQTPRRDAPLRHHSIRAILDYTWSHLAEDERAALSRLSIFRTGFHDRSALSVATVPLRLLYSLVHRSLLYRIGHRYRMHGLVRLYAEEKLRLDGAAHLTVIPAHRDYYATLLQEIAPQLKSAGQMEALSTIADEFHDIEAAWAGALADHDWSTCGSYLDSLYLYHEVKGPFQRGRDLFEELIRRLEAAASREGPEQVILGKALAYSGRLATRLGLYQQGAEQLQHSLDILDRSHASPERAFALKNLGYTAYLVGDYERATGLISESLTMRRALAELWEIADSLNGLGVVADAQGKHEQAWDLYCEAMEIQTTINDRRGIALSYNNLGDLARTQGKYQQAKTHLQHSYEIFENLGDRWGMSIALNNLGDVAFQQEDHEQAYSLIERSLSLRREIGDARGITVCLHGLGNLAYARGDHATARRCLSEAFTMAVRVGLKGHEIAVVADHLAVVIDVSGVVSPLAKLLQSIAGNPSDDTGTTLSQILELIPEFEGDPESDVDNAG